MAQTAHLEDRLVRRGEGQGLEGILSCVGQDGGKQGHEALEHGSQYRLRRPAQPQVSTHQTEF